MTDVTRLFTDLVRVETRLYNAVDARLRAEHGLPLGQYEFLSIIQAVPGCRVLDIVQEVGITVGAVSKAVDRLEAAGLCLRAPNPDDRRSSLLSLTEVGARRLAEARPTVREELQTRTGAVPADSLARTAAVLGTLRTSLEADQEQPPRDGDATAGTRTVAPPPG